jgi:nucleoid-associated protein YgaU
MFFKGSRYANVADATFVTAEGREVRYKKTRIIGPAHPLFGHVVDGGERLDHIAWRYYRDAERFWRICDANFVLWPNDLLQAGQTIVIPPSEE